jgi:hypothetical protein
VRKTLATLTMAGLLVVAACGQNDPQATAGRAGGAGESASASRDSKAGKAGATEPATGAAAPEGSVSRAATASAGGAPSTTSTSTPTATTSTTTATATADRPAYCDGAGEPAVRPLRQRAADAPPECLGPEPAPAVPAAPPAGPTPEPVLGTGDVQVTLRWESNADVDLHVTEPAGTELWFGGPGPSPTGGRLDVDSNVGCVQEASVENVFWPTGGAPAGEYTVEVNGYQVAGCGSGAYTVTAQVRGRQVLDESGEVGEGETDTYTITA